MKFISPAHDPSPSAPRFPLSTLHSLLITLFFLSGCNLLLKPAEVELVGLAFSGERVVDLSVRIRNPNAVAVRASEVEYTVNIGPEVIGQGRTSEVIKLGPRGSVVTRFPLSYDLAAMVRAIPQLTRDTVVCQVQGSYRLEALLFRPKLRFAVERRVAVKHELLNILRGK